MQLVTLERTLVANGQQQLYHLKIEGRAITAHHLRAELVVFAQAPFLRVLLTEQGEQVV